MNYPISVHKINGVNVALYPMKSVGVVVLEAVFKAGCWYENEGEFGINHYLEHMVHQGTEKFVNSETLGIFKEDHGINQNASTGGSSMAFSLSFPEESLTQGLTLFDELVFHPIFPENTMNREKSVVRQEFTDRFSQPGSRYWRDSMRFQYGEGHIYTRHALGNPDYVDTVTQEMLFKTHEKFLNPSGMSLALSGNFDEKDIIKRLGEIFKHEKKHTVTPLTITDAKPKGNIYWHKEDQDRVSVSLNYFVTGRENLTLRSRMALGVGRYILGGSSRSLLFKRLREELGHVYSAGAGISYAPHISDFDLYASTSPDKVREVVLEILKIYKKFLESGTTDEAFNRAKKYLLMMIPLGFDSPYRIAESLAYELMWDGAITDPNELISILKNVTMTDVLKAYEENIGTDPILTFMSREDQNLKDIIS